MLVHLKSGCSCPGCLALPKVSSPDLTHLGPHLEKVIDKKKRIFPSLKGLGLATCWDIWSMVSLWLKFIQREDWQLWVLGSTSVLGCGWEMARPDPSSDPRETSRPLLVLPSTRPTHHLVMGRKLCSKQGGPNILTNTKIRARSHIMSTSKGCLRPPPPLPVIVSILLTSPLPLVCYCQWMGAPPRPSSAIVSIYWPPTFPSAAEIVKLKTNHAVEKSFHAPGEGQTFCRFPRLPWFLFVYFLGPPDFFRVQAGTGRQPSLSLICGIG